MTIIKNIAVALILCSYCMGFPLNSAPQVVRNNDRTNQEADIEATVRKLLESGRPPDRAWGAYMIGSDGLSNLAPLLYKLLDHKDADWNFEQSLVDHCALDSLIQQGQSVPARMVVSLFNRYPDETLILAAKDPDETQGALLGLIMQERRDLQWFAIANILSKQKTPGFAALLASDINITISVEVVDNLGIGTGHGSGLGSGCSSSCGGGVEQVEEYPPIGLYRISDKRDGSDGLVSDGIHPIFFKRRLVAAGDNFFGNDGCSSDWSRNTARLAYLANMLQAETSDLGINLDNSETIECHNIEQYRRQLTGIRAKVETSFGGLVARLVAGKLVSSEDAATLRPKLAITIFDSRTDKSFRLTRIDPDIVRIENR